MKVRDAKKITGSMTRTKKMPGLSYSLPAWECITGKKLRKVPGSVCEFCYALKGNYTRYPAIKAAQYYRLRSLKDLASLMEKLGATKDEEPGFTSWTLDCGPGRQATSDKQQAASHKLDSLSQI